MCDICSWSEEEKQEERRAGRNDKKKASTHLLGSLCIYHAPYDIRLMDCISIDSETGCRERALMPDLLQLTMNNEKHHENL